MIDYLCGALCHVHLVGLQNSNDYLCGALCHVQLVGLQNNNDYLCGALCHVQLLMIIYVAPYVTYT